MTCPCHNIARDAKDVDRSQAEECADTCIEGDRGRLPQQFCQHRNRIVRVVIIVDRITGEPHIVGRKMLTAHDG